jgi:predicted PhzF superfamily epimerase YddE/YHI9
MIQQCGAGLVRIRRAAGQLAFAAPALAQADVGPEEHPRLAAALGIPAARIRAAKKLSHLAPCWTGVLLASRAEVLALRIDRAALDGMELGVVAPWPGGAADFEVRAFAPDIATEDPVTGSLNAGLARWLIGAGLAPPRYVAAQGTCLGREGRVHVTQEGADFWIGGACVTCIEGRLTL